MAAASLRPSPPLTIIPLATGNSGWAQMTGLVSRPACLPACLALPPSLPQRRPLRVRSAGAQFRSDDEFLLTPLYILTNSLMHTRPRPGRPRPPRKGRNATSASERARGRASARGQGRVPGELGRDPVARRLCRCLNTRLKGWMDVPLAGRAGRRDRDLPSGQNS